MAGWGPPPPYSRGSTSELGSISASTPIGSLSPAHRSPVSTKEQHVGLGSSSTASSSAAGGTSKDSSLRKASDQRASGFSSNLPARQQPNKNMVSGVHPSPVSRMNIDPRRMPWSPQTAGITPVIPNGQGGSLLTRNIPAAQQTGSPSGMRQQAFCAFVHYYYCSVICLAIFHFHFHFHFPFLYSWRSFLRGVC